MNDVDALTRVLQERFSHVTYRPDFGWPTAPLNVIDCVLSLNRRYNSFVLPRVQQFQARRPEIMELGHLRRLIDAQPRPLDFSLVELNYNDADRARILSQVLNHMQHLAGRYQGDSEMDRLRQWAVSAKPEDYLSVNVLGFGLSGYQYMRMLFGAQTTKPDVHIRGFVSDILGRRVTDVIALRLLEQAAERAGLLLREVDGAIWQSRARP